MRSKLVIFCTAAALTGCAVGPNYKRPVIATPQQFRAAQQPPEQSSLGDMKWFDLFQDETLRGLLQEAVHANYDVRIAAQRVIEGQGRLMATRSGLFPWLSGQASAGRTGTNSPLESTVAAGGVASWEIDLFGKLRRATEAARADLLATEENQKAVMQALVT